VRLAGRGNVDAHFYGRARKPADAFDRADLAGSRPQQERTSELLKAIIPIPLPGIRMARAPRQARRAITSVVASRRRRRTGRGIYFLVGVWVALDTAQLTTCLGFACQHRLGVLSRREYELLSNG
jgi:hypothetical protein